MLLTIASRNIDLPFSRMTGAALAVLFALFATDSAWCALLAHEEFAYTASTPLNGQNGGIGWSGAWAVNPTFAIGSGSLSHVAAYPPLGNRPTSGFSAGNKDIRRNLATPVGNGTTYFSFLLRPEGVVGQGFDNGTIGLILSAGPITSNDLFVGKPGDAAVYPYVIEGVGGGGQQSTTTIPVADETVLLVVRADMTAGTDTFRLYVNPSAASGEPGTPDAIKNDSNMSTIASLYIAGPGAFSLDEIRIGSTYEDVVAPALQTATIPEPSTCLLVAGLMAVAALVRRRNLSP